ncbi:hypothetical protein IZ6_03370 [Terrihabitans soli]|uniref:Uncharacterized protein n=1 Tax=Terrihabitans soli TaxID=708113 RepID=A0A6S6QQP6_9HYPH|nr:hypothetical protein [Terrihabitans soli]BCJ89602.1 hypothetical protein IZ6_03370 [Terrihabitans soli]
MCICDDEEADERVLIEDTVLARARILDAARGGGSVADEAWAIFAGKTGGSVAWPDYQRMQTIYESAANLEKRLAHMRRERRPLRRRAIAVG